MFIRAADRDSGRAPASTISGYVCEPEVSGRLVTYQFHSQRIDEHGVRHLCDVHWKIANPQRFADAIAVRRARRGARAASAARTWRARHRPRARALAGLYASSGAPLRSGHARVALRRSPADGRARRGRASRASSRWRSAPASGASACARCCSPATGSGRRSRRRCSPPWRLHRQNEPSTMFLRPGVRKVDVLLDDVRVLPGWRAAADAPEGTSVSGRGLHATHVRERLLGADPVAVRPSYRQRRGEVVPPLRATASYSLPVDPQFTGRS